MCLLLRGRTEARLVPSRLAQILCHLIDAETQKLIEHGKKRAAAASSI
jgi:hypothetical protein